MVVVVVVVVGLVVVVVDVEVGVGVDVVAAAAVVAAVVAAAAEIVVVVVVAGLLLLLLLPPPLLLLLLALLLLLLAVDCGGAAVGAVAESRASSLSASSLICCFNREASMKSSTCTADAFAMLSSAILEAMLVRAIDATVAPSSREAAATLASAAFCKHVTASSPFSPPPVTYDAVLLAWHIAKSRAWPFVASAAISTIPTSAKTPTANQVMHLMVEKAPMRRHTRPRPAAVVEDATAMGARAMGARSSAPTSRSRSSGLVTVRTAMAGRWEWKREG